LSLPPKVADVANSTLVAGHTERMRPLLGTFVTVRIRCAPVRAVAAFAAAFAAIEQVQSCLSFHDIDSELSQVNRGAAQAPMAVSSMFSRVLRASLALARASSGHFDPTIAARLVHWNQLPAPSQPTPELAANWRAVELTAGRRVQFHRPIWLDFGGIAKGYAVDRAVAALKACGVTSGLVNAGGDLRVFGDLAETIAVRDPRSPGRARPLLQLREGAVATSAGYFSADQGRTALINPLSGLAVGQDLSVSVSAPRAIWADALTKVVLAAGANEAEPLLRRLGAQAMRLDCRGTSQRYG
jgi:FAD:protein FMN transferase